MWTGLGFCAAVLVGTVVALIVAARGEPHEEPLPWSVPDIARMQASLMSALGGVSITGIVLILSFATNRAGQVGSIELNTVGIMFAVAFGYFLQTFFALCYLPDRTVAGERLFRFYFQLATTLEWRTIILLVVALVFFVEFYGLATTTAAMNWFVPAATVTVFLVMAVISDSLGLMRFGECVLTMLVGFIMAAMFIAGMKGAGIDEPYAQMIITLIFGFVNGLSYVGTGLVPLTPRRPRLKAFLERNARRLALIDMQVSVVSIVFLWVTVSGVV